MKWWKSITLVALAIGLTFMVTKQLAQKPALEAKELELIADEDLERTSVWLEEGPVVGAQAPDFTLTGLDGKTYSLSDLAGEKPVVVNFWASWCPPCKDEAPDLVRLREKYDGKIEIYAVNLTAANDTVASAELFAKRYGFQFPVLLDETGEVGKAYQVLSLPTSYFIDKSGRISNKLIGITTPEGLEKLFANLIGTSG